MRQIAMIAFGLVVAWSPPGAGAEPAATTLRVASYNVQFVTPDLPVIGGFLREWPDHKPNVAARAAAIGRRLACFDVVALQETINNRRRQEIFAALEAAGRSCGKPSRLPSGQQFAAIDGPDVEAWWPPVDDELAFATRLPVLAVDQHVFGDAAEEDVLAAKGVLHVRLDAGEGRTLEVFTTHLQAGRGHAEVRRTQIAEMAAFVGQVADRDATVLLLGDFNIWGGDVDRANPASEYNFLMRELDRAVAPRRFVDLWLATHADDPETDSGTKPRVLSNGAVRPREKRIDHILVTDDAEPVAMRRDFFPSALVVDGAPLGHLSNHAALLAEMGWRSAGPQRLDPRVISSRFGPR